jgi:eukaryotic-like serine/threonine-protein kinase
MAGDSARAESLAQDLGNRFPLDTQMQSLWLPAIQAQLALNRKNPASALERLQAAIPIELGLIGYGLNNCLYHVYVRGEAYLAVGQGTAAADEFQKVLDHSGLVGNCWTGALAHLGVAVPTLCSRELRREGMPTPPASGRSPPTKISSLSGKTPTPKSPS